MQKATELKPNRLGSWTKQGESPVGMGTVVGEDPE